jgi:hypothetical protein
MVASKSSPVSGEIVHSRIPFENMDSDQINRISRKETRTPTSIAAKRLKMLELTAMQNGVFAQANARNGLATIG